MYSPAVLLFALAGLFLLILRLRKNPGEERVWLVLILAVFGLFHNLAFPGTLPGHDYMTLIYSAGICLLAAVAYESARTGLSRHAGRITAIAVGTSLILVCVVPGLVGIQRLYAYEKSHTYALRHWGKLIGTLTEDVDVVAAPMRENRIFQYYVRREMEFEVVTEGRFLEVAGGMREGRLHYACPLRLSGRVRELLKYLDGCCTKIQRDRLILFSVPPDRIRPLGPGGRPGPG